MTHYMSRIHVNGALVGSKSTAVNVSYCNYYWEYFVTGPSFLVGKIRWLGLVLVSPLILTNLDSNTFY